MKVLLKEDVEHLGFAGEVHKVAPGYGRNYLIPKNLAVKANSSAMKQAAAWRKKAETRRAEIRAEYEALSARIKEVTLTFTARAGENGRLYGSVTTAQITDKLNETLGTEVDRRRVGEEALRQLGSHSIVVRLSGDFQPHFNVIIESEEVEEEIAADTADDAADASEEAAVEEAATEEAASEVEVEA